MAEIGEKKDEDPNLLRSSLVIDQYGTDYGKHYIKSQSRRIVIKFFTFTIIVLFLEPKVPDSVAFKKHLAQ